MYCFTTAKCKHVTANKKPAYNKNNRIFYKLITTNKEQHTKCFDTIIFCDWWKKWAAILLIQSASTTTV